MLVKPCRTQNPLYPDSYKNEEEDHEKYCLFRINAYFYIAEISKHLSRAFFISIGLKPSPTKFFFREEIQPFLTAIKVLQPTTLVLLIFLIEQSVHQITGFNLILTPHSTVAPSVTASIESGGILFPVWGSILTPFQNLLNAKMETKWLEDNL